MHGEVHGKGGAARVDRAGGRGTEKGEGWSRESRTEQGEEPAGSCGGARGHL